MMPGLLLFVFTDSLLLRQYIKIKELGLIIMTFVIVCWFYEDGTTPETR